MTIKEAFSQLQHLQDKFGEDGNVALILFSKEDIDITFKIHSYDKSKKEKIYKKWDENWANVIENNYAEVIMSDLNDRIYPEIMEETDISVFNISKEFNIRELNLTMITQILTNFGYDKDDIYIDEQYDDDDGTSNVSIYINKDRDFSKLRTYLEDILNTPSNKLAITYWDIHHSDDLVRPFITIEYKYEV